MEACGGARYWSRRLLELGYRVRLLPPQFVKPFVVGNKTGAKEADAIFAASRRASVRAVPVKPVAQQDAPLAPSIRQQWIQMRTALVTRAAMSLPSTDGCLARGLSCCVTNCRPCLPSSPGCVSASRTGTR